MVFSLTSQMSVAALQISAFCVFYKDIRSCSQFLKSQRSLLGENSNVNVKVSKGLKMVFIKEIVYSSSSSISNQVVLYCLNRKTSFKIIQKEEEEEDEGKKKR